MQPFRSRRAEHEGSFLVAMRPEAAFDLFTPEGERAWAGPEWDPEPLYPTDGTLETGAVFRTRESGGAPTYWMNLVCDRAAGRLEYLRLTPTSRLGVVSVDLTAEGDERTRVGVRYRFTSTCEAGNVDLDALTSESYSAMLSDWERRIARALDARGSGHERGA